MKQLIIAENESQQRFDRFLRKYLAEAPVSFIYKMIRKKNITLNNKKVKPETIIVEGDTIELYLADNTIAKFKGENNIIKSNLKPEIIYEDDNIILMNKAVGLLSHSANNNHGDNLVDGMINYLYEKGEYDPKNELTFAPSICNRLDRNTSGIVIGAKNYQALKIINNSMKKRNIDRYYKTIVKGVVKKDQELEGFLTKDGGRNKVKVEDEKTEDSKEINTKIKILGSSDQYSLLEIELITGRTHQIRAHLASIGHPIIGDTKYGDKTTNLYLKEKYNLKYQFLHCYRIMFSEIEKPLDYLNNKEFIAGESDEFLNIQKRLF